MMHMDFIDGKMTTLTLFELVYSLKVPYYTVFHQYIIGLRYKQTFL